MVHEPRVFLCFLAAVVSVSGNRVRVVPHMTPPVVPPPVLPTSGRAVLPSTVASVGSANSQAVPTAANQGVVAAGIPLPTQARVDGNAPRDEASRWNDMMEDLRAPQGNGDAPLAGFDVKTSGHGATFAGATGEPLSRQPSANRVAMSARGGGEYDVSDADIQAFYAEVTSGSGGDPPKGSVVSELIVKFFHGEFTPQGFKRYSGLWKGPPPGSIGKKDISVGIAGLKEQMKNPMFVSKGGVGYGVDESQKVTDDGKGWVWLAAEMSPGGLAVELFKSVPYGKRALIVAKASDVDEMFAKVNWDVALKNIDKTLGGPQVVQR